MGSSLRMQGQPRPDDLRQCVLGFIPADAGATYHVRARRAPRRVHPCGCRGNGLSRCHQAQVAGSSLRMQGQRLSGHDLETSMGFIPADAGATPMPSRSLPGTWVHPCGCRGNSTAARRRGAWRGSSLRMQGQLPQDGGILLGRGFIPADAGATATSTPQSRRLGVHPCGCRGNQHRLAGWGYRMGSSLRMQGQQQHRRHKAGGWGFIPADAGATNTGWPDGGIAWVHPCGCRGNPLTVRDSASGFGSSLRMQGQLRQDGRILLGRGFIPADAGATHQGWTLLCPPRVHPCGCRGNVPICAWTTTSWGSSLRMQGQRLTQRPHDLSLGFIPADAGATAITRIEQAPCRVHPCGCRGNAARDFLAASFSGSSLRMQGQHQQRLHRAVGVGFIPADAGATTYFTPSRK